MLLLSLICLLILLGGNACEEQISPWAGEAAIIQLFSDVAAVSGTGFAAQQ
jgi:hypothetical protein